MLECALCAVSVLAPWCLSTTVRGLGLRVGDVAMLDGDGVLASGDSGILCTDLRLCGDFSV